jgi:membrane protein implicated in regulation of membrane protease activity
MGVFDDAKMKALIAGFVLSLLALVITTTLGLLMGLSALFGPASLFAAVAPYVVASMLSGLLSFALLVALSVAAVRRASVPRDERLATLARRVERVSDEAREYGLAERFEPTTEERIEDLKDEYVAGEITELEYERRLRDLLSEADERDADDLRGPDPVERELDALREREDEREQNREREREFER